MRSPDLPASYPSLTPLQRQVAKLIGRGFSRREVARRCGCGERTIRSWMSAASPQYNPDFVRLAQQSQEEIREFTAVEVLRELLHSPSEAIRLQAARTLLMNPEAVGADPESQAPAPGTVTFYVYRDAEGNVTPCDPPDAPQTVDECERLPDPQNETDGP